MFWLDEIEVSTQDILQSFEYTMTTPFESISVVEIDGSDLIILTSEVIGSDIRYEVLKFSLVDLSICSG